MSARKFIYFGSRPFQGYVLRVGQSNQVGVLQSTEIQPSSLQGTIENTSIWSSGISSYTDLSWGSGKGPEYPFAYKFQQLNSQPLVIEKEAQGSTGFKQLSGSSDWNAASEELALSARTAYSRLYQKMISDGYSNPKIMIDWNIGETDASSANLTTKEEFKTWMLETTNYITTAATPDLVIVNLLNASRLKFSYPNAQEIRQAQIELVQENSNWVSVDLQNYDLGPDDLHYVYPQIKEIGFEQATLFYNRMS